MMSQVAFYNTAMRMAMTGAAVCLVLMADLKVCATTLMADLKVCATTAVAQAFRPALAAQAVPSPAPTNSTLTAVPGIKVGHHTLPQRPTGCTVVLIEAGATAGVDVRGAAPATRDTDLLNPTKMVQQIHGIALSGGSLFGLSSGDGVLRYLEEKDIGIQYAGRHVPIVTGASIFDLGVGDARVRPTADCGYRAAQAATSAPVVEGSVGAGAGATLGKLGGMERAMRSGVGSAAIVMPDGLIVAALVVVNPLGDVIDPATGQVVAGVRTPDGRGFADARVMIRAAGQSRRQFDHRSRRDERPADQSAGLVSRATGG